MKKISLLLVSLLAVSACSNNNSANTDVNTTKVSASTPAESNTPVAEVKEKKAEHYAVGTTPDSPPFMFKDERGLVVGFEREILQAIADDQNFSLDVIPAKFSDLFKGLEENKYQIVGATLAVTPERQAKYELSKPYITAPNVIMGKEGGTVKTLADIGEHRVTFVGGTVAHELLEKHHIKNLLPKDSLYTAYGAFIRGEADYVIGDAGVLNYHHLGSGVSDKIKVYTSVYDSTENNDVAYLISKGNTQLLAKINKGLDNIRANGKYDEIYKKWFGDDQSLKVQNTK